MKTAAIALVAGLICSLYYVRIVLKSGATTAQQTTIYGTSLISTR